MRGANLADPFEEAFCRLSGPARLHQHCGYLGAVISNVLLELSDPIVVERKHGATEPCSSKKCMELERGVLNLEWGMSNYMVEERELAAFAGEEMPSG